MIELKFKKIYANYDQQPCDKKGLKNYRYIILLNDIIIAEIKPITFYYPRTKKAQYSYWVSNMFLRDGDIQKGTEKECLDEFIKFVNQWLDNPKITLEGNIKPCKATKAMIDNLDRLLDSDELHNVELGTQINNSIKAYTATYIANKIQHGNLLWADKQKLRESIIPKLPF